MRAYTFLLMSLFFSAYLNAKAANDTKCQELSGKKFETVELLTGGATPQGISKARWTITFKEKEYFWMHTDLGESAAYQCKNGIITAGNLKGKYNSAKKELLWDKVKYRLANQP
jgi:hypothetical protein